MSRWSLLLCVAPCFLGCAEDEPEVYGEAPSISGLSIAPEVLPVGERTQLEGSFDFVDPEGDVAFLGVELRLERGASQRMDDVAVAAASGVTAGQVPFVVLVEAFEPGAIDLGLWLIDGQGNESNELVAELVAE